jgi:hypothetical protein
MALSLSPRFDERISVAPRAKDAGVRGVQFAGDENAMMSIVKIFARHGLVGSGEARHGKVQFGLARPAW